MKLSFIAERVQGLWQGEDCEITGVSNVQEPRPGTIALADSTVAVRKLTEGAVAAVLTGPDLPCPNLPCVRVTNPKLALAGLLTLFQPACPLRREVYPGAFVEEGAKIGANVAIMPFACIMAEAEVGDGSEIHAGVFVGRGARVGRDCVLKPGVFVGDGVRLGDRVVVHPNAVLGGDGFGYVFDGQRHVKIPQIGTVEVGDDVEIGAGATVDRATLGRTVIGRGTKIDNLVQVAHNVTIGEHTIVIAQAGIAGSTTVGNHCILAGQAGITDHSVLEDGVIIGAKAGVEQKRVKAGSALLGIPARDHMEAKRIFACFPRLPELLKRVAALEERLKEK